jgi:ubiquinone/menaquinone biosynthesis C-methylase UbiE
MNAPKIKLNIGCGPNGQFEGFINIDNSKAILLAKFPKIKKLLFKLGLISKEKFEHDWTGVRWMDASRRLPFASESVDKIFCSHFLEHIPPNNGENVLKECYRVLKKDGIMRLVVPDLLWYAERYVSETMRIQKDSTLPDDRTVHDKFLETVYGAYLNKKRYGASHCYMYDLPTLVFILKKIGFEKIHKCQYQEGEDKEMPKYDTRPEDSLHIEITGKE